MRMSQVEVVQIFRMLTWGVPVGWIPEKITLECLCRRCFKKLREILGSWRTRQLDSMWGKDDCDSLILLQRDGTFNAQTTHWRRFLAHRFLGGSVATLSKGMIKINSVYISTLSQILLVSYLPTSNDHDQHCPRKTGYCGVWIWLDYFFCGTNGKSNIRLNSRWSYKMLDN